MEELKEWYYAINQTAIGPISRSELIWLYNNKRIFNKTKVWKIGMADWTNLDHTDLIENVVTPPPIPAAEIDNSLIWIVSFSPLLTLFLRILLLSTYGYLFSFLSICIGLASITICIIDEERIKKSGYDTKETLLWAILFIPVYLFRRAYIFKQSMGYAFTWLALYLFELFFYFCIILARLQ